MPVYRADDNFLYYLIYGNDILWQDWTSVWLQSGFHNTHLTVRPRPTVPVREAGFIDMTIEDDFSIIDITTKEYEYQDLDGQNTLVAVNGDTYSDIRTADRLTLDNQGFGEIVPYVLALKDVEYVDAPLYQDTHLRLITKDGFTTDGSLKSIWADVGHHEFVFTSAKTDSTLFTGEGHDDVRLSDNLDLPGEQYWTLVRRDTGEIDAYDLVTGNRVRMTDGYKAMGAELSSLTNYGEVERVYLKDYRNNAISVYSPGERLNYEGQDARGNFRNIDLRSDGELDSDSFNLAYFNFIRYTTDNVWVGEATIHDGSQAYLVGDQQVAGAVSYDLIGTSRNGTHDLIISEQTDGVAGNLRVYSNNVSSGAYNTFNDVYVGDSGYDAVSYATNGSDWDERVALYGFGGNDVLKGGAGYDYIFGGQSLYDQVDGPYFGNIVTGGAGADYFGVGHTNSSGVVVDSSTTKTIITTVNRGSGVSETNTTTFHKGYGTDAIMDWDAGTDTLVVLKNGVAVIAGLYGEEMSDGNTIDLRFKTAVATSDQDNDGARGGAYAVWDADSTKTLDYIFENQQTRDEQSIFNESDISVINDGLIVARGLGGNDLIYASAGADYIYGNAGVNTIILDGTASSAGSSTPLLTLNPGEDRVYYDTRAGKQYVANFQTGVDKFYLAKNVIDAFDPSHASSKSWNVVDGTASYEYTTAQAADQNITFIHNLSFKPLLSTLYGPGPYTNMQYAQADFISDSIDTAAGAAMYSIGGALWAVPFVGPALAIPFYVLGGIFQTSQIMSYNWDPLSLIGLDGIVPDPQDYAPDGGGDQLVGDQTFLGSNTHLNSTYKLTSGSSYSNLFTTNYVYVLDSQSGLSTTNTTLASDTNTGADNKQFLEFFHTVSDGFIPALELNPGVDNFADVQSLSFDFDGFTDYVERNASDYGVYAYFAVHSNNETFVYLINSRDNLITNDEAFLVAEINGKLTSNDFNVYNGGDDIYNQFSDHPEPGVEPTPAPEDEEVIKYIPTITSVDEQLAVNSWSALSEGERTSENALRVNVAIDPTASSDVVIKVYDSMDIINDLPLLVGQGTVVNGTSTVTINDNRVLGQTIIRTDFDIDYGTIDTSGEPPSSITISDSSGTGDLQALSEDNSFEYFDAKISYYAVAESNISGGFTVKESSDPFTVVANGPSDDTIYGGAGTDTLFLSATSQHLNTATDAQITGIERITVKTGLPPVLVANKSIVVDGLNIDYAISSVTIADAGNDLAAGYYELTFTDDDAEVETPATGWFAKVDATGRVVAVVTNDSGRGDYDASAPATPAFSSGLYYDSVSITASWEMIGVEIDLSNQGESGRAYDFYEAGTLATYDAGDGIITSGTPVLDLIDGGNGGTLDYVEAAGFEITGASGDDTIIAGAGDDTITGLAGQNSLAGGAGNDLFRYYGAVELLDDTVAGDGGASDTIVITYNDDDGNGVIDTSLTVSDVHFAHASTVEVLDLSGNQVATAVTLQNQAQAAGIRTVYGADNTTVSGTRADSIDASSYTTAITIVGGAGDDTLHAGSGVDSLSGGTGNDVFLIDGSADHSTSETINGGSGTDTIRFTSLASEILTLSSHVTDADNLIYVEISDAAGSNAGTTPNGITADLLGADLDVYMIGNDGANSLTGNGDSNNTIIGGAGNDIITGGAQADSLIGGSGDDVFKFASGALLAADTRVDGGETGETNGDTIYFTAAGTVADASFDSTIAVGSIENVRLTGASTLTLGSNASTAGISKVYTGSGATSITRTDTTSTSVDASVLGNDTLLTIDDSGVTTNFAVSNLTGDLTASTLAGTLNIGLSNNTSDGDISLTLGTGSTTIIGGHSSDNVTINTQAVDQYIDISGSDANHVVNMTNGAQTLIAGTGVDTITTGAGSDDGLTLDRIEFHTGTATANINFAGDDASVISQITTITDYNEDEIDFTGTDTVWSNQSATGFTTNGYGFATFDASITTLAGKIQAVRTALDASGSGDSQVVAFIHGDDTFAYSSGVGSTANDDQIVRIAGETALTNIVTGNSFVLRVAPVSGTPTSSQSLLPNTTTWSTGNTNFTPTSFDPGGTPDTNLLLNGLGGSSGFGTQYTSGDDRNQAANVTFDWGDGNTSLNMFGTEYSTLYMGTNGYVTFGTGYSGYVPSGIAGFTRSPMIAGQFDDLYVGSGARNVTSGSGGGNSTGSSNMFYYGDANKMVFTWDNVGLYANGVSNSQHSGGADYGSAFQIILWKGTSAGDFGIEIRYEDVSLQYATATAGWTAGDTINYQLINPSSSNLHTAAFGSNVGQNGLWAWEVSGGTVSAPYYVPDVDITAAVQVARVTFPGVTSTQPTISGTDGSNGFVFGSPTDQMGGEYAILSTTENARWNLWKDRYVDGVASITLSAGGVSTDIDVQIINTGHDSVTRTGNTLLVSATSNELNSASNSDIATVTAISAQSAASSVNMNLSSQTHALIITGSNAKDSIYGGSVADTFVVNSASVDQTGVGEILDGNGGTDTLVVAGGTTAINFADDTISEIEVLDLTVTSSGAADPYDQTVTMTASQVSAFQTINANGGDKLILTTAMSDALLDNTVLNGTLSLQTANVSNSLKLSDGTMSAGDVLNVIASAQDASASLNFDGGLEAEGTVSVIGGAGSDVMTGTQGRDTFSGAGGDDLLILTAETDTSSEVYDGGAHSAGDTIRITGTAVVDISDDTVTNFEAMDLTTDTAGQGVTMTLSQRLAITDIAATSADVVTVEGDFTASVNYTTVAQGSATIYLDDTDNAATIDVADAGSIVLGGAEFVSGDTITISDTETNLASVYASPTSYNTGSIGGAAILVNDSADNSVTINAAQFTDLASAGIKFAATEDIILTGVFGVATDWSLWTTTPIGGNSITLDDNDNLVTIHTDDLADIVTYSQTFVMADNVTLLSSTTNDISAIAWIDNLTLTGTAAINGTGNSGDNVITGNTGANSLVGGLGDDTIIGGAGNDSLSGGDGNDVFIVNGTADISAGEVYNGGADFDTLSVTATTDFTGVSSITLIETISLDAGIGATFDAADLSGQTLAIDGSGNDGGESLTFNGTSAGEVINLGGLTVDVNDISGAVINAGDGNDTITGTNGIDTISGGAGNDVFKYTDTGETTNNNTISQMDVITDFNIVEDSFDLSGLGAVSGLTATVDPTDSDSYIISWQSGDPAVTNYVYVKDTNVTGGLTLADDGSGGITATATAAPALAISLISVSSTGFITQGDGPHRAYFTIGDNAPVRNDTTTYYTQSSNVGASTDYTFALADIDAADSTVRVGHVAIQSTNTGVNTYLDARVYIGGATATNDTITTDISNGLTSLNRAIVYAQGGDDTVTGSTGDDYIYGGTGNDSILSAGGADVLDGGDGNDVFVFTDNVALRGVTTVIGGAGTDVIKFTSAVDTLTSGSAQGNNFHADFSKVSSVEVIELSGASKINLGDVFKTSGLTTIVIGNDDTTVRYDSNLSPNLITIDASNLADGKTLTLTENAGVSNFAVTNLKGDLNASTLADGVTATAASGTGFAVSIAGGSGNDILTGGAGNDTLTGGSGADIFVFSSSIANGSDTITDFSVSDGDRLDLSSVGPVSFSLNSNSYIVADTTNSVDSSGKVTTLLSSLADSSDEFDTAAEIASKFGEGKALSLGLGSSTIVIAGEDVSADGTFPPIYVWHVQDNGDGVVEEAEVTLLSTINGFNVSTLHNESNFIL